jgi:GPH family glycoside/pentoside/hexuronide:cation symporter
MNGRYDMGSGRSTGSTCTDKLPLVTKIVYGSGDWSLSSFNTFRQLFYAIFLTDVVGVDPRLASLAALIGVIWDAVNDPIMGTISDRVHTRWGRRRPFLLWFSVPFGLAFVLLWWAPPWQGQMALTFHVTIAYILTDTLQTVVSVPFYALTPELTPDYDERTSLTAWRMFFNLCASMAVAVAAPSIVDVALETGLTQTQGYLLVASLFGGLGVIPFLVIFAVVRERESLLPETSLPVLETLKAAWENIPFRYLTALYMLNWITFDLVGLMIPFFMTYQVAGGNLVAKTDALFGVPLPVESAMLGTLILTALLALPFWTWLSQRLGKPGTYMIGMSLWIGVQLALLTVDEGEFDYGLMLAGMAGISVATAHVIPDAMLPDVVDYDQLRTGKRNEGVYYGAKNLLRKLTGALAIFLALQILGWSGYHQPAAGATSVIQAKSAMWAIRLLTGPAGAILLIGALLVCWHYPLTRACHEAIRAKLDIARSSSKTV